MLLKYLSLPAVMAAGLAVAQSGGYTDTCSDCRIDNFGLARLLTCTCGDGHGGWPETNINLNNCFANVGGFLVYARNGDFVATCYNIGMDPPGSSVLIATCGNGVGGSGTNHIDMNSYIGNTNGKLVC